MKLIRPNILSPTDGSFSRASVGTYVDADNILKVAGVNQPRFHYLDGEFQGILVEPAATNLITNSEILLSNTGTTVIADTELAPDGTTTADLFVETATLGQHYSRESYSVAANTTLTFSAFVKRPVGVTRRISLLITGCYAIFDFDLKDFTYVSNTDSLGSESIGNDYYRIWITKYYASSSTIDASITLANTNNDYSYLGDTAEKIIVWGRQLESGSRPSSYIKTSGSAVTRAADVITGSGFIYSSAINADANYAAGTTYALGNRVTYSGKIYESLQNTNTGHAPDTSLTWWLLIGPDNKHAALDNSVSTVSSATGELTLVVKPGAINSCGLVDMAGSLFEFAMRDLTDGVIFSQTIGLSGIEVNNWYDYFFLSPLIEMRRTQYIFQDLPSQYTDPIVTLRIKNGTEAAKLALASFGFLSEIGEVEYGASAGIVDFSVKSTDDYGNTSLVQRNFSKRLSARCFVPNRDINRVQRTLYSIRATPVVWIGVDDPTYEEAMIVWGFYKDFTTEISYPTYSLISIEIEGLS